MPRATESSKSKKKTNPELFEQKARFRLFISNGTLAPCEEGKEGN